ncbi:MAG: nitrilase-related carbon-nitrogen hydrolase [Chloroflexota bacterium]|nr:nitrilase-related carbon-nitrogen hydrolase [Chloroflexota bacterium]
MQPIRVALIQLAWTGTRLSMKNCYRELVAEAAARGASLVCLPELSISPYFPGTRDPAGFQWAEALPGGESERLFAELADTNNVTLVGSLFEKTPEGNLYDTATIHAANGALVGVTRKIHIPSGTGYHETDFFEPGDSYPVFDTGTVKLATPTCYDQWFPELARIYSLNGADYIFYPTAIGAEPTDPAIDTHEAWQTMMRAHAIANGVFVGAANRTGVENGVTFYGSSFICDPMGRVLASAGRDTTEVIVADLDPQTLEHWRELFPLLRQRMPGTYARILGN